MRKVLSTLLAILMIVSVFSAQSFTVHAADEDAGIIVSIGESTGQIGDTVEIPITLTKNDGVIIIDSRISYDSTYLVLSNVEVTDLFSEVDQSKTFEANPYALTWRDDNSPTNITNTGLLATLTFEILARPTNGEVSIAISFEDGGTYDANEEDVTTAGVNGKVIIEADSPTVYTVSFDANGGTGTMKSATVNDGEEYILPANGFTAPNGKQFKAWSVGGDEKEVGAKITVTADTTVTAVWEDIPHTHSMTKTDAKAATCKEAGNNAYYTCSGCGKVFKDKDGAQETTVEAETLAKLTSHSMGEWSETKAPTETEKGEKQRECSVCGKVETSEIPMLIHTHSLVKTEAKAATCKEAGNNEYYTCSKDNCGMVFKDKDGTQETTVEAETIAKLTSHSWGEWSETKAPTETERGEKQRECSICGKVETGEIPMLAHTHSLVKTEAKAATCKEAGNNEYYTCSKDDCGMVFKDKDGTQETTVEAETLAKLTSHSWGEWSETKAPTITEEGEKQRECSVCGEKETETIPVIPCTHSMTKTDAKAATCKETGNNEYYTCSVCGKVYKDEAGSQETTVEAETLAKLTSHSWGEWSETKAPTETEKGEKQRECPVCGEKEIVEIPATVSIITATAGNGGTISPSGETKVTTGTDQTFTITANKGYIIKSVKVDGKNVGAVSTYTFTDVDAAHTIAATFSKKSTGTGSIPYYISVNCETGGSIVPDSSQLVSSGGSITFTMKADEGYEIADVTVDGKSVGAVASYTFSKVYSNHSISVKFKKIAVDTPVTPDAADVKRYSGDDRIATAIEISKAGWASADTVIIASSENYPDALAGATLSKKYDAPVLLNGSKKLDATVVNEINRLGAKNIIILGGTSAISEDIAKDLAAYGSIDRISDDNRNGTAAAIAYKLCDSSKTAFLVSNKSYADALSVSSVAAITGTPVLYVNADGSIPAETKAALDKLGCTKVYIIGGTSAVSGNLEAELVALSVSSERVFGEDRYLTAVEVNKKFADVFTSKNIAIATGQNYPDALAGGGFAAKNGMQIYLFDSKAPTTAASYIKSVEFDTLVVFGGTNAVAESAVQNLVK